MQAEESRFRLRFTDRHTAILFQLSPIFSGGRQGFLATHNCAIVSSCISPADNSRLTVDITVRNGGEPVSIDLIRELAQKFPGFTGEMGTF